MSESSNNHPDHSHLSDLLFGAEIIIEEAGFSFHPIEGFELEIDGSIYMYSEDGNLEINLVGGELGDQTSIADLNDSLAAEFMENFDDYQLVEAGTDSIQGITGFLNEIRFTNAEEEGMGRALICSPFINQYFFILMISSADHWQKQGIQIFEVLKNQIRFHPQFKPEPEPIEPTKHPDLTIETYSDIAPDEEFVLNVERGDLSLLLAARSYLPDSQISLTRIIAPDNHSLYSFDPETNSFESGILDRPLRSDRGELCIFFPRNNQHSLQPGEYTFSFDIENEAALQEIQFIIKTGKALDVQKFDINFWIAVQNEVFNNTEFLDQFEREIYQILSTKTSAVEIIPGNFEFFQPAPDEIETFNTVTLQSDLTDCSYMISESIDNRRALNIGLVDTISQDLKPDTSENPGVSCGSPGMILAPESPHTCVMIAWDAVNGDLTHLADAIIHNLVRFCGIDLAGTGQENNYPIQLNREIAWRLKRHPLFYDAD